MPQFGRPEADTLLADWQEDDGTTTDIFDQIDEVAADDADFIRSPLDPTDDPYVCRLSDITDPVSATGHVLRYRYRKDVAAGDQVDLIVQLREAYVNEGTPGTLIVAQTHTDIPAAWTAGSITLSAGEANSITDYTALFVRLVANTP